MWKNKTQNNTFFHVPHIVVMPNIGLPQEHLDLGVTVHHNTIHSYTLFLQQSKAPLQALFLHVVASTNLITLYYFRKQIKIDYFSW